jgi:hypothetical protein
LARLIIFLLLKRVIPATRTGIGASIVAHIEKASWWLFRLLGLLIALPAADLPDSLPRARAEIRTMEMSDNGSGEKDPANIFPVSSK